MGRVSESISPMPLESVRVLATLPASADRIYAAWLDGAEHGRMTGGAATVDARLGGEHTAWDGYIEGSIVELEPGRRIVQTWRSSDFPLGHSDSRLEVHLRPADGGCEVILIHTQIPEGQGAQYEKGWSTHYLEPMRKYFAKAARKAPAPKRKKKAAAAAKKRPVKKVAAKKKAKRRKK